jgi:hypothetical protein
MQNQGQNATQEATRAGHQAVADLIEAAPGILLRRKGVAGLTYKQRLKSIHSKKDVLEFSDPISLEIMDDPITINKQTFSRAELRNYFAANGNPATIPCPITRFAIPIAELNKATDMLVKNKIEQWVEREEETYEIIQAVKKREERNAVEHKPETNQSLINRQQNFFQSNVTPTDQATQNANSFCVLL